MIDYRDALGQGGAVHGLPAVAAALAQGGWNGCSWLPTGGRTRNAGRGR